VVVGAALGLVVPRTERLELGNRLVGQPNILRERYPAAKDNRNNSLLNLGRLALPAPL
jgi:hypothetical protein